MRRHRIADPVAVRPILLHAGETTIQVPFSTAQAQQLKAAFQKLYQVFVEKQKATRPKRWDMLEWSHADDKVACCCQHTVSLPRRLPVYQLVNRILAC